MYLCLLPAVYHGIPGSQQQLCVNILCDCVTASCGVERNSPHELGPTTAMGLPDDPITVLGISKALLDLQEAGIRP